MKKLAAILLFAALTTFSCAPARAAEPNAAAEATFKRLFTASVANDYDAVTKDCDEAMKAALTKSSLEMVSKQIGPRAKDGYDALYLGELSQHGYAVHLWRLRFKSGGDDILATLSLKDGKVGGFYLH